MHAIVLNIHSWLRWVVLILGLITVLQAFSGLGGKKTWTISNTKILSWFTLGMSIQFLLGFLLYLVYSSITQAAFEDFGGAMKNPVMRFWAVEHVLGMLIALALAHIGKSKVRKSIDDAQRFKRAAIFIGLSLLITLASIPWPFMQAGRALFRL